MDGSWQWGGKPHSESCLAVIVAVVAAARRLLRRYYSRIRGGQKALHSWALRHDAVGRSRALPESRHGGRHGGQTPARSDGPLHTSMCIARASPGPCSFCTIMPYDIDYSICPGARSLPATRTSCDFPADYRVLLAAIASSM
jgi:hypothetical protein